METLKKLGCGTIMLYALMSMYEVSYGILGAAIVTAVVGVRQGSPSSCFLFTCFVDELVKLVKCRSGEDGFLRWLHLLMLMDDTIVLATSRDQCIRKLQAVVEFCEKSGMVLNQSKTKFMVINSSDEDRLPLNVAYAGQAYDITWCDSYVYLGSIFTSDGKIRSSLKAHAQDKHKHFIKFVSFISKNPDFPFVVKRKVLSSALLAAILYGCESWLLNNLSDVNKLYLAAIKTLLGVRQTTANEVCLVELGLPQLKFFIKDRQLRFFKSAMAKRQGSENDPLMFVLHLAMASRTSMGIYLNELLAGSDFYQTGLQSLQDSVKQSERTKLVAYTSMNPQMKVHNVYLQLSPVIPEYQRLAFTRLRLISHNLRIETGRWSRLPREDRLCSCGDVQTEQHMIELCPITKPVRDANPHMTFKFAEFFNVNNNKDICNALYLMMDLYH